MAILSRNSLNNFWLACGRIPTPFLTKPHTIFRSFLTTAVISSKSLGHGSFCLGKQLPSKTAMICNREEPDKHVRPGGLCAFLHSKSETLQNKLSIYLFPYVVAFTNKCDSPSARIEPFCICTWSFVFASLPTWPDFAGTHTWEPIATNFQVKKPSQNGNNLKPVPLSSRSTFCFFTHLNLNFSQPLRPSTPRTCFALRMQQCVGLVGIVSAQNQAPTRAKPI